MIAILFAAFFQPERAQTDARCIQCHEAQPEDWKGSVHEKHGVGCIKCHGADSVDPSKSRPHLNVAGFLRGTKKTNPKLCAACHQNEFAAFDRSAHAEETRDDSGKVKGCISCHEFHATASADRHLILRESCAKCHREGTAPLRLGESYIAYADTLPPAGRAIQAARVAQHEASPARYAEIESPPGTYNTTDAGPPWPVAAGAMAALGAAFGWILRPRGRKA